MIKMKSSSMKKQTLKTPRRKVIPHHYQKKSNTSLSQLLAAASYKKRINDLARNNRSLALALQQSRCEAATQATLLKDYSRDRNYLMFARLKLKDVVKSISNLVMDLDEVMNYLDVGWASTNIQFTHKDRSPSDEKLKVKVPSFSVIEEASTISEHESPVANSSPKISSTSGEILHQEVFDSQIPSCSSVVDEPIIDGNAVEGADSQILFVDETGGQNKKSSDKHKNSRRQSSLFQRSLTPELDIDLPYKCKRSNSLKQFECDYAGSRKTRSGEKKSESSIVISPPIAVEEELNVEARELQHKKDLRKLKRSSNKRKRDSSPEQFCSKSLSSVTDQNTSFIQSPVCRSGVNNLSNLETNNDLTSACVLSTSVVQKATEVLPSVKTNSTVASHPDLSIPSVVEKASVSVLSNVITNIAVTSLPTENKTLLMCEDMELTDVIPAVNCVAPVTNITVPDHSHNSEFKLNVNSSDETTSIPLSQIARDENKESNKNENIISPESTEIYELNSYINNPLQKITPSCNTDKKLVPKDKLFGNQPFSPISAYSVRTKKPVKYSLFFSDDSESDSTPLKSASRQETNRVTAVFMPKVARKTPKSSGAGPRMQKNSLPIADESLSEFSVFDFNSSASETSKNRERKQQKKSATSKRKTTKSATLPSKPLSKKCSVTKLKGFGYKFSKESSVNNENELNDIDVLSDNKYLVNNVDDNVNGINEKNSDLNVGEVKCSTELDLSAVSLTPNSDAKRISFAATDLVCNFKKMSQSKTISTNKKVSQTSKCLSELEEELSVEELNNSICNLRGKLSTDDEEDSLFDFSGETELYTLKPPTFTFPIPKPLDSQSQKVVSVFTKKNKNASDDCSNKNNDKINRESNNKVISEKRKCSNLENSTKRVSNIKSLKTKSSESSCSQKKVLKKFQKSGSKENFIENNSEIVNVFDSKKVESKNIIMPKSLPFKENYKSKLTNLETSPCDIIPNRPEKKNTAKKCKTSSKLSIQRRNRRSIVGAKSAQASPILKDVMNLENQNSEDFKPVTEVTQDHVAPRRRSKPISYKEPSLHTKMRRQ